MMRVLFDFLFLSIGMGLGVALMCMLQVGKEADRNMEHRKESEEE